MEFWARSLTEEYPALETASLMPIEIFIGSEKVSNHAGKVCRV